MNSQVLYVLVVHWKPTGYKIIASCPAEDTCAFKDIVIDTIKDFTTVEENKISITRNKFIVHLLFGELCYACLTPFRVLPSEASEISAWAQFFLERVQSIYRELPILADLSHDWPNICTADFSKPLKNMMIKSFDRSQNLQTMHDELDDMRIVLLESVQKLIDRGQRLDDLIRKTQTLEIKVRKDFRLTSRSSDKKNKNICITVFTTIVMLMSSMAFGILLYIEILR